jgi:twitching motility protein PilT
MADPRLGVLNAPPGLADNRITMSEKKPVALIGRLAIQLKLIDMDQLNQATAEQARVGGDRKLGDIFIEKGFLNPTQLAKLENVQKDVIAKHRAKQAASGRAVPAASRPVLTEQKAQTVERAKQAVHETAARAARDAAPVTSQVVDEIGAPPAEVASPPVPPPTQAAPKPAPQPQASTPVAARPPAAPVEHEASQPTEPAADEQGLPLELVLPDCQDSDRQRLEQILADAVEAGASDVHIHSGSPLKLRVNGDLMEQTSTVLSREEAERMVVSALTPAEREQLCRDGELDYCFDVAGVGRFRANTYMQQRGFDVVYRSIPAEPPSLADLGLPQELAKYTNYHQGMVLITGPAGCGKSATMSALVNLVNEERQEHILTIEDPIEVVHPSKRCLVNQRHAGKHTQSFARALRGALREDPDVIVIGELRDLETISLAMTAAETGHFVLATLHTNNAVRTINRIIGAFPSNEQGQVRTMLSESLRAVISQRLVPTKDGSGRVPALEMLVINKAIGNLIRDEKTVQIRSAIQTGKAHGMYLLEQSLNQLVQDGKISKEVALAQAEEKKLITATG